mgnify:CR=1 FL=1
MRTLILAAFTLACSHAAFAQEVIAPPAEPAPAANASADERTTWCEEYATWLLAMTENAASEAQQSQHPQVELNSCRIDPQQYERETRAQADAAVETAQG